MLSSSQDSSITFQLPDSTEPPADQPSDPVDREIGCFDKGVVWVLARTDGGLSVVDVIPPHRVTELALVGGPGCLPCPRIPTWSNASSSPMTSDER